MSHTTPPQDDGVLRPEPGALKRRLPKGVAGRLTISPARAKAGDVIQVMLRSEPGGYARFCISAIPAATDVPMLESPEEPGAYVGTYTVAPGENVSGATVTATLSQHDGPTYCFESRTAVALKTVAPRIRELKVSPRVVRNGQAVLLAAVADPGCEVVVTLSKLDSTQDQVTLSERPHAGGSYVKRIRVGERNAGANGEAQITAVCIDSFGNTSEPTVVTVELRNSELHLVRGLEDKSRQRLNRAGVVTLGDLRRIDLPRISRQTGIPAEELRHYRAAARLQAVGLTADLAHALVHVGNVLGPTQLAMTPRDRLDEIIRTSAERGLIPGAYADLSYLPDKLIDTAAEATDLLLASYRRATQTAVNTCRADCAEDLSIFSAHAYLLKLVSISNRSWAQLEQEFKWDFLTAGNNPIRCVDLSVRVLERALIEDLGNPPRRASDWAEYDRALNYALVRVLIGCTGESEATLAAGHPDAFASVRSLAERNQHLANALESLRDERGYFASLVARLEARSGKTQAALAGEHPEAFDPARPLSDRSADLEKILGLPAPADEVRRVRADLAGLQLQALVAQSGKAPDELRKAYHLSFSGVDCGETSSCHLAILSLQDYLADKAQEYPSYDAWRLEQVEEYYPSNVYEHVFKTTLIRGNRELLANHLAQARAILETVRVSTGNIRPSEGDRLNSFEWRNPYYANLRTGIDLIQDCYDIDDLMVRGHQAFFDEEYIQARHYYLEAAQRIRSTSKKISQEMGDALLPLYATGTDDCYFRRSPADVAKAAADFLDKTILSFCEKNKPGVDLGKGQISLKGVESDGRFNPAVLDSTVWEPVEDVGWDTTANLSLSAQGELIWTPKDSEHEFSTSLVYKPGSHWTDLAVKIDVQGHLNLGAKVRYGHGGWLTVGSTTGPYWVDHLCAWGYVRNHSPETAKAWFGLGGSGAGESSGIAYRGNVPYSIRIEVRKKGARASLRWWNASTQQWEPVVSIPASDSLPPITMPGLPDNGTIALTGWNFAFGPEIRFSRLTVWDLSSAKGAVSDRAFFLRPRDTPLSGSSLYSYIAYLMRPFDLGQEPRALPLGISFTYDDDGAIVQPALIDEDSLDPAVSKDKGSFDPFYQESGTAMTGLWYDQGDARLRRENLREVLDGLIMLLCHQYFFLLPVCLGDVAKALGQSDEALQWYRLVYDERRAASERRVYPYLNLGTEDEMMRLLVARNYVEWADLLFNQNTEESVQDARRHYTRALSTMGTQDCCGKERDLFAQLKMMGHALRSISAVNSAAASRVFRSALTLATRLHNVAQVSAVTDAIRQIVDGDVSVGAKIRALDALLDRQATALSASSTLAARVRDEDTLQRYLSEIETRHVSVLDRTEAALRSRAHIGQRATVAEHALAPVPWPPMPMVPLQGSDSIRGPASTQTRPQAPLHVPYEVYADTAVRTAYSKLAALVGLPGFLAPQNPLGLYAIEPWDLDHKAEPPVIKRPPLAAHVDLAGTQFGGRYVAVEKKQLPLWARADMCIPLNPEIDALTRHACLAIFHIDHCFNALGFPQEDLSIYRFDYLLAMAKSFAQMSSTAEKDFVQFKAQFESNRLELLTAQHAVSIGNAGMQLANLRESEALDHVTAAYLDIEKVNSQIAATSARLADLGSSFSVLGIIFGGLGGILSAGSVLGAAGAAISAIGSGFSYMGGLEEQEENLRMQLQVLKTADYNAARQNLVTAMDAQQSVWMQARIAELEARFAAEKAQLLATDFFNPQLWSFLAREVKKNYRVYLTYATIAGWLAQRALESERGIAPRRLFASTAPGPASSGLNIIRFDYFQPSLQGLLGVDGLLRDLAALEQEKVLHEQRKKCVTKVISLASTHPYLFARFLQTGELSFATTLEEFDWDFPGHYQRRIRTVRLNVFGIVGQEGIKATLTCLGTSKVVVKETIEQDGRPVERFMVKTLRRPSESVALTSPVGGPSPLTLAPNDEMLNPFEGFGVATQWQFVMPRHANEVDFNTIADIQVLIDYTALDDPSYRQQVLARLSTTRTAIRAYSFCADFADACFHLKEGTRPIGMIATSDETTGTYTLALQTRDSDFPPNQRSRRLNEVVVYFRSKDESANFANLRLYLSCGQRLAAENLDESALTLIEAAYPSNATMVEAETGRNAYDPAPHYLGRWQAEVLHARGNLGVADTWYLHVPPQNNPAFVKKDGSGNPILVDGHEVFDFSGLQDVIFALHYKYDAGLPAS